MPFYSRLLPRTEIVHNCLFRSLPTPLLPRHLPALFRRVHPCVSVALRILGNCSLRRAGSTSAAGDRDVGSGRCSRRLFRQLLPALLYLRHPCRRPTPLYLPVPGVVPPPSLESCFPRYLRVPRPQFPTRPYLLHPWSRALRKKQRPRAGALQSCCRMPPRQTL